MWRIWLPHPPLYQHQCFYSLPNSVFTFPISPNFCFNTIAFPLTLPPHTISLYNYQCRSSASCDQSKSFAVAVPASRSEINAGAGGINVPEKPSRYLELASSAMDELMKLGQVNAPLWNQNMETGGETLNFNEYVSSFPPILGTKPLRFISEASRATGVVLLRSIDLVEALLLQCSDHYCAIKKRENRVW
ncbi:hypothetical protein L2E82_10922 [Cichorium intybus]|uniref:Uncharacterized protein n=1 Tax=Cichorium intybus TaxID=13427 RepID=A0ACB9GBP3_CICIN|nr:hypothetical protein L2E82_10922 [Cichorium intybus]